jgi:hypothetical protein
MTLNIDDRLMGRAVSQTFDALAPAERPGRWGPDPIGAALRIERPGRRRRTTSREDQAAIGVALIELVGEFIERFDPDPAMVVRVADVVAQTPQLVAVWATAMSDDALGERTTALVGRIVALLNQLARDLITTDDLRHVVEANSVAVEAAFEEWMMVIGEIRAVSERDR